MPFYYTCNPVFLKTPGKRTPAHFFKTERLVPAHQHTGNIPNQGQPCAARGYTTNPCLADLLKAD